MNPDDLQLKIYLGDGLYAGWDGYHVILWCERDGQLHWVALEDSVYSALTAFVGRLQTDLDELAKPHEPPKRTTLPTYTVSVNLTRR